MQSLIAPQQKANYNADRLAMSFFELARPENRKSGFWASVSRRIAAAIKEMQRARMYEAMNRLSDEQLSQLGLTRQDVPQHVERCIES